MSIHRSEIRRLNRILGDAFGYTPAGQSALRWEWTGNLYRHVCLGSGYLRTQAGVLTLQKQYDSLPWSARYGQCWIVVKWKHYTPEEWYAQTKDSLPYPKNGEWEPFDGTQTDLPTVDLTESVRNYIFSIRDRISEKYRDNPLDDKVAVGEILDRDAAEQAKAMKDWQDPINDFLDDAVPAMEKVPGSHGGATEFMSGH